MLVLPELQLRSALVRQERMQKIQDHLFMDQGAIQPPIALCTIVAAGITEQIENHTLVTQMDRAIKILTCQDLLRTKQRREPTVLNTSVVLTRAGLPEPRALVLITLSSTRNLAI